MNDTLKEALEFATTKEREAEKFYRTWVNQASNPAVKALFSELAETERGHAEKLSRIAPEDLIAQGRTLSDLGLSDYLVEVEPQPGMSLQDALILAMKREEASAALYERLSQFGGNAQSLFAALVQEECCHKRLLEAEYDDVVLREN